jgi:PIN domain nuclease of toxin-antitoxin system
MKYLLDTHILIWSLIDTKKLSKTVKDILENPKNMIYVSSVNFWEISIKNSLGNLEINNLKPDELIFYCEEMGLKLIDLTVKETATLYKLSVEHHKDPIDRILIWQAIKNDFTFISDDKNVKKYVSEGLKVIG